MKRKIRIMVMAFALTAIMVLTTACGSKFDASGYVKACLDVVTRGEKEEYMKLTKRTEEEAEQDYQDAVDSLIGDIDDGSLTDEMQEKYETLFEDILKKTKYEVKEAVEDGDNFTVDVEVEQLTGVFNGVVDELNAEAEAYYAEMIESGEDVTEEEALAWVNETLYNIIAGNLEKATYNEKQTVTVHVVLDGEAWDIPQEDYDALYAAMLDMEDVE